MSKKEWFSKWFDSPYYHILYKNRNTNEAQLFIDNLFNFLNLPLHSNIIDLACGKGRHAAYIASLGYNVLGIDLSKNSIDYAKKTYKQAHLKFEIHDMRRKLDLDTKALAVFNFFTSFGYFESIDENIQTIRNIKENLKPNGYFCIDFFNGNKVVKTLVKEEEKEVNGILFYINRSYDNGRIVKNIHFNDNGIDYHFTERVQALTYNDFNNMLSENEFNIEHTFGDYNLAPYNNDSSNRLIIIARNA